MKNPQTAKVAGLLLAALAASSTAGSTSSSAGEAPVRGPEIFNDGFESADTSAWNLTTPTVRISYPYSIAGAPPLVPSEFRLAFWVEHFQPQAGGDELRWYVDGVEQGSWDSPDPIPVSGLSDGLHYLTLRLASPSGALLDASATVEVLVDDATFSSVEVPGRVDGVGFRPSGQDLGYLPRPSAADLAAAGGVIPPCPTHNRHRYHALYDAQRNCHYNHEHKDDPSRVDDVFGPTWAWLPAALRDSMPSHREIGYPWETWAGLDAGAPPVPGRGENDRKHEGFGWMVRRPDDYPDFACYSANSDYCITHHRYQYHAVSGQGGARTRTHSIWIEARVCAEAAPNDCGLIRTGGHIDFSELRVDTVHVPLPWDPPNVSTNGRRLHGSLEPDSVRRFAKDFTWYPEHRLASFAVRGTTWGPVDPTRLSQQWFYCEDPTRCHWPNGDMMESHLTVVNGAFLASVDGSIHDEDGLANGRVTYHGFTDRSGALLLAGECDGQPLSVDCVPVAIENLPTGQAQYRDDSHGLPDGIAIYDTSPEGQYWIQYPN